jgi:hypothetical protein
VVCLKSVRLDRVQDGFSANAGSGLLQAIRAGPSRFVFPVAELFIGNGLFFPEPVSV